jgi:hypothetical protein
MGSAGEVLEPTGVLHLIATEEIHDRGCDMCSWRDSRQQRVDDRGNDLIVRSSARAQYSLDQPAAARRHAERAALVERLRANADPRVTRPTTASRAYREF